jgi:large subunit ribosomal protein L33
MSQDHLIKLKCSGCGQINYWSHKNRKRVPRKIEVSKYCPKERAHKVHKEIKK